jgi:hypothetical protein
MTEYRLTDTPTVVRTEDNVFIPDDPDNRDRIAYDQWLADGGVPDPYVPPDPGPPPPDPMAGEIANQRIDAGIIAAVDSVNGTTRASREMPPHSTPPTPEELQAQVDYLALQVQDLAQATGAMLQAQADAGKKKAPV